MDTPKPPIPIPRPDNSDPAALREHIVERCKHIADSLSQEHQPALELLLSETLEKLERACVPANPDGTLTELQRSHIETALTEFDRKLTELTSASQLHARIEKLVLGDRGTEVTERVKEHMDELRSKYDVDKYYLFRLLGSRETPPPGATPLHFDFPNEEDAVVPFIEKLEHEFGEVAERL